MKIILIITIFLLNGYSVPTIKLNSTIQDYSKSISNAQEGCFVKKVEKVVKGFSMQPLIKNESKIFLLENYYCQNQVAKGDLIAYKYAGNELNLIKIVKVTDQDLIELNNWNLFINGQKMTNSQGEVYSFTEKEKRILKMYIKDNHLPKKSFFIFGDNVVNSKDSRKFGAVSAIDFSGKFIFE